MRSTPESGERAGYGGAKRKKGSEVHMAVDTLGHLLALNVTPTNAQDRGEVERLARAVQAVTDDHVEIAWVDRGYTGKRAAEAAAADGVSLKVVKLPEAKRASSFCPAGGWSSARSPGPPTSAASSKTTNDNPRHSRDFTSSLSPAL